MPKPSGEWLREDISHYRLIGVEMVVSLLEPEEERELFLCEEGRICREARMDFLRLPVPDRGLPETAGFKTLVAEIVDRLGREQGVAVHCRAGIGRSGMVVCCALSAFMKSTDEIIALVSVARGVRVPDTEEQRRFIESFALGARDPRGSAPAT